MATKTISKPYEISRKAAAMELYQLANNYEQISYSQVYRRCFYDKKHGTWRLIGKAHDYTY